MFEREPDALVVVLNYDEATVRFNRAMIELGYDPFDWPEPLPPALIAAMQAIDDGPAPVDAAFNHRMGPERGGAQPPRGLRGYVYLPARQDLAGGRFLHEFAHFWAADIESPRVLARQIDRFHGHWGFSSMGGVLGGWLPGSRVQLAPGRHRADVAPAGRNAPVVPFAPFELYLMGLIDAAAVPPLEVAVEPVRILAKERLIEFTAAGFESVRIEDILAENGGRIPARPDPGTPFQIGLVVLAGSVLTAQEWEFYERAMDFMSAQDARRIHESFAAEQFRAERAHWQAIERGTESALLNFFGATGGRGSLVFSRPRLHDQGPLRHRRTTTTPSGTTQIIGGSGSSTARAPAI